MVDFTTGVYTSVVILIGVFAGSKTLGRSCIVCTLRLTRMHARRAWGSWRALCLCPGSLFEGTRLCVMGGLGLGLGLGLFSPSFQQYF